MRFFLFILLEHCDDAFNCVYEIVGFFKCVVYSERSACATLYAETLHQRLGTMVSCTNGYSEFVKQKAEVIIMYVGNVE